MADYELKLRQGLREVAGGVRSHPAMPPSVGRRARRGIATTVSLGVLAVSFATAGIFLGLRLVDADRSMPATPAPTPFGTTTPAPPANCPTPCTPQMVAFIRAVREDAETYQIDSLNTARPCGLNGTMDWDACVFLSRFALADTTTLINDLKSVDVPPQFSASVTRLLSVLQED